MKYSGRDHVLVLVTSLPPRERGLKSFDKGTLQNENTSLPPRERGLKFCINAGKVNLHGVAPSAGAWIEIHEDSGTVLRV